MERDVDRFTVIEAEVLMGLGLADGADWERLGEAQPEEGIDPGRSSPIWSLRRSERDGIRKAPPPQALALKDGPTDR